MKFLLATLSVFCFFAYVHAEPKFYAGANQELRRGVSVVGPAKGICAGVEDAPKTAADKSRVYISRCSGAFGTAHKGADAYDKTWGYLSSEVVGMAMTRGADGQYLTAGSQCKDTDATKCTKANNMYVFTPTTDLTKVYTKMSVSEKMAGSSYAFSSTGAYFGDAPTGPGLYAGTATYLVTNGSITTSVNKFDVAGTDKAACIAKITGQGTDAAKCGTGRTFSEGQYKFSLFGYTTDNAALNLAKVLKESPANTPYTHLGFRQLLKLGGTPTGATITGGVQLTSGAKVGLTNAEIGGKDVKGFQLCVNKECLEYAFPTKYNYGKLNAAKEAAIDKDAVTSDVKIKVSVPPTATCTKCAYIDYLVPVGKMTTKDWWFAYDPEVKSAKPMSTSASAAPHTSQLSFVAAAVALMVAFMKF